MICTSCNITVFTMPALPIGIYRQGSKLLDTLKSYYVKEAGMSFHTFATPIQYPLLPNTVHLGRVSETMSS